MTPQVADQLRTLIARVINGRERTLYPFDAEANLKLQHSLGIKLPPIGIRVCTKSEQDKAVLAAYKYVESKAIEAQVDKETARSDADLLRDAKTAHILFEACRAMPEETNGIDYPAFLGPKWMCDKMTTQEFSVLMNAYLEVLRKEGLLATEEDMSSEAVERMANVLAEHANSNAPDFYLTRYTREQLGEMLIRLSMLYVTKCLESTQQDPPA